MAIELKITGMTCAGCEESVAWILKAQPGVEAVAVDLSTGRAIVEGDTDPERLTAAVAAQGFGAELVEAR
ncbi:heavy-metal-associated domain-containing protein [Gloeobacter morelensis]|uniref:Heavy-metal-associated domain-containing protein n=1 Tax=Gloeobacter morelensis MG652769 TaxID=2781736 RepID=A0ABY3PKI4_9CYAN|nr:heavy metal-associated domain-containing protein [Gloeobacter morelensis]UFP94187.1 heavy-metal-associated domain-containing protein [Gloeobacter morelensis MG652769]